MRYAVGLAGAVVAGLLALAMLAGGVLVSDDSAAAVGDTTCAVTDPGHGGSPGALRLDPAQLSNARIIVGVAVGLHLPARAPVVALAAARQESGLHNLPYGDRDSLGLFQMRPSMGWGSPAQILDPVYASTTFYRHLTAVPEWTNMPVTVAAQAVERSAYPDAYAQWVPLATALAAALLNDGAATVTCAVEGPPPGAPHASGKWPAEQMNPDGLTPRTEYVKDLIERTFGEHDIGGYCPGGCTSGHIPGSDHYTGHAIDVMILPYTDPARVEKGWRIADWLVTNARPLAIKYLIYRARYWSPSTGWEAYHYPGGPTTNPTLLHMDHIHISIY